MMEYAHLTDEEINYELTLRHVVNFGPATHRNKVLKLKTLVQEDQIRDTHYTNSEHVMSPTVNLEQCQARLSELQKQLASALSSGNLDQVSQTKSRLFHYRDRLAILHPPGFLTEAHLSLSSAVNKMLREANSAVNPVRRDEPSEGGSQINRSGSTQRNASAETIRLDENSGVQGR